MAIFKRILLAFIVIPSQIAWAESPHAYFDWLAQQPEIIVSNAYRTQAEIDRDSAPKHRPNSHMVYDSAQDAAKAIHSAGNSGVPSSKQVRPSLNNSGYAKSPGFEIFSGNLLFTWDAKWGSGFLNVETQGLETHKEFQLSSMGADDDRQIEIRSRYVHSDPTFISKIDARSYMLPHAGDQQPMGRGGCGSGDCQINEFNVHVDTWTRYWAYVDYDNKTFSLWMADENNSPVKLFDNFTIDYPYGLNAFWFEYNSSQSRSGPEIYAWFRNFSVLQNVSNVAAIVAQGASVGAGPSDPSPRDTTPPSPPKNLDVR